MLVVCWLCVGCVLVVCWLCVGCVLVVCWLCVGCVLVVCWLCVGCVLVVCWLCVGCVLVVCWLCVGCVLVVCWLCVGCVLVVGDHADARRNLKQWHSQTTITCCTSYHASKDLLQWLVRRDERRGTVRGSCRGYTAKAIINFYDTTSSND